MGPVGPDCWHASATNATAASVMEIRFMGSPAIRWDVEPLRVWARGGFCSAVDVAFLFETRNDPVVIGGRHQTRGHVPQVSSNGLSVDFYLPIRHRQKRQVRRGRARNGQTDECEADRIRRVVR